MGEFPDLCKNGAENWTIILIPMSVCISEMDEQARNVLETKNGLKFY